MVVELNAKNFEKEVIDGDVPVIIDFWAEWCGPCQMMKPVFEELSKDFSKELKFCKLNVDENSELSKKYGVQGIPCLIILKKGEEVDRIVGMMLKETLKEKIQEILHEI